MRYCQSSAGGEILLMTTNYDSVAEKNCFQLAQQNKIDGIIALSYSPDLEVDESVPVVTIDRHFSVPPGGKIKDAVIANDLHIFRDPDPPASQEFADPDSQAVGVAEDAVKFQFPFPDVIVQELQRHKH